MNETEFKMSEDHFERLLQAVNQPSKNAFEQHAQTALTSLIVLLLAATATFVFRMSDNQDDQLIEIRVLQFQVENLAKDLRGAAVSSEEDIRRLELSYNTIWPRLRAHGENLKVLTREIEELCNCEVKLTVPEDF